MTLPTPTTLRRTALAAAMVMAGGLFAAGSAQAVPFAPPPADAIAADNGVSAVHWRHHHHHWGHHHHHRRHFGGGWGHRHHHHHHGWGWGHRHHHHHHHRRHHHW